MSLPEGGFAPVVSPHSVRSAFNTPFAHHEPSFGVQSFNQTHNWSGTVDEQPQIRERKTIPKKDRIIKKVLFPFGL